MAVSSVNEQVEYNQERRQWVADMSRWMQGWMVMKWTDGGRWTMVVLRGWEGLDAVAVVPTASRTFRSVVRRVTKPLPNPTDADAGRLPAPAGACLPHTRVA